MAKTTLLPTPLQSGNVNENFKSSQKTLLQTQASVKNIGELLIKRTKVRKEIFSSILEDREKRDLATRRREREDEIETKKTVFTGGIDSALQAASASGGSFLGKLVKALGFITAGWILRRLPTWIGYAKEFIARIEELGRITRSFVGNITSFFSNLFNTLGELKNNLLRFDLFDSQRNVRNSFDELTKSIDGMEKDFEDAINVFTTDLTKQIDGVRVGSYSGEEVPEQKEGFTPSPPDKTGTYESAPSGLFELIAGGEGGYESMNRGNAGDSPGGAKKYLGKNLQDMTLSEIMSLQSRGTVFAVGKYQIITQTMPGFVNWLQSKGYDPKTTKYSAKIQDLYPQYTVESKRPIVGKFLSGSMNDIQKANLELAAEFASVGVPFDMKAGSYGGGWPKYDIKKGESLYSGRGGNRASITPEQVQKALAEAKKSGGKISAPSQTTQPSQQTKVTPLSAKVPALFKGEGIGAGRNHMGRDIATEAGTALVAFTDGTIITTGLDNGGYGYYVVWKDSSGVEHLYGHMLEKPSFANGQKVSRGTILGRVGSTGRSSGPHLHWEISPRVGEVGYKRSNAIDPLSYGFSMSLPFAQKVSKEDIGKNILGDKQKQQPTPTQKPSISSPTPSPAQVSTAPTQQAQQQIAQQITPERKAQDIVAVVPPSTPQQPTVSQGPAPSQQQTAPSIGDMLNNFIKQKFLLDLSFL
jgi:murein DD-endopeptidase MepM/ murein hydrolase activator NlpD